MNTHLNCPACGNAIQVADAQLGKPARCPHCRERIVAHASGLVEVVQAPAAPAEPVSASRSAPHYSLLHLYAVALQTAGLATAILPAIFGVGALMQEPPPPEERALAIAAIVLSGIVAGVGLMAAGQGLTAFRDLVRNSWR